MAKSRIKVPKRVAGVKIPRAVRKGPVMDFVNSSEALKRNTARLSFAFGEAITAFRTALGQPSRKANAASVAEALANQLDQVKELVSVGADQPSLRLPLPERIARAMHTWAARRVEQRLRDEWSTCDHRPDAKLKTTEGQVPHAMTEPFAALFEARGCTLLRSRHPVAGGRKVREQWLGRAQHLEHLQRVLFPVGS
jgi:hypothetical protein